MVRTVIIDDEKLSVDLLVSLLNRYCPKVEVVGTANSAEEGYKLIKAQSPDLVFLDVEMPGGTGFDLLGMIKDISFSVIFTTAFDKYALKAIKSSAIDYLLKPISIDELISAVTKIPEPKDKPALQSSVKAGKMVFPTREGLTFVEIKDIIRCEADGRYTTVIFSNCNKITSTHNLKEFEDLLSLYNFYRIHHTHLVNQEHIRSFIREDGGYIVMDNGDSVPISKRKKEDFLNQLKKL